MESIGLLLLATIQLVMALAILFRPKQSQSLGLYAISKLLPLYRYLLASLWATVSGLYVVGAFFNNYTQAALLLGIINVVFEIISYWFGYRDIEKMKFFPYTGTLIMSIPGIICIYEFCTRIIIR